MTYIVPHFRYGAPMYHNIGDENGKKFKKIQERIQQLFNKITKNMYDLPLSTPKKIVEKTMGNWNVKTLALTSFVRCAKI